ncbi:MAG: U32 family peptidase [Flavobacteriales bacterium]|nr:U32 family peptidase [Flavobacteriales bacterium]
MPTPRPIELLCPAKDLATAICAIDHGADAVYIGADDFSARSNAGNSVEDIATLVEYAHCFGVRVYVTLNTIIKDDELPLVEKLINRLYECGVDALIVQDMAVLEMNIPPIELHASTQTDIRTVEKASFLYDAGYTRLVLARELSLSQIENIHSALPNAEIECFIHGALCVCYSGQCYMSEAFTQRSANRGRCAQVCRLPFTVKDDRGDIVKENFHALSLKDMNRSAYLEKMIDAGVTSLKIEGRLKDISYVKNITAFYRTALDGIFSKRKDIARSSFGTENISFTPKADKSFNRGFTDYFIQGERKEDVGSPLSPKSWGEKIGTVVSVGAKSLKIKTSATLNNGDGFCFVGADGSFSGFRIDRATGNEIFPSSMPKIKAGVTIFRNYDIDFLRTLSGQTAKRYISLSFSLTEKENGYSLCATTADQIAYTAFSEVEIQDARTAQNANITSILSKTGDTVFKVTDVAIHTRGERFIPSSVLTAMRRECTAALTKKIKEYTLNQRTVKKHSYPALPTSHLNYSYNVYNHLAESFYLKCGAENVEPAFETSHMEKATLAQCAYCLRYSLGQCPKINKVSSSPTSSFYLLDSGKVHLRADFFCKECEMRITFQDKK